MLRRNNDFVEIGLHQFCDQVYLLEKVHMGRLEIKVNLIDKDIVTEIWNCNNSIIFLNFHLKSFTCKMSRQDNTFSCLKNIIILSSRKTRFELTKLWKTFGSFFRATRFPSRGSVTDQTTPKAPYPIGRSGW